MDKNSNTFTFGFAIVMVIIVALVLSSVSIGLKPIQQKNIQREKMQNILSAINVQCSREEAYSRFDDYVKNQIVLDHNGQIVDEGGTCAFDVDVQKEFRTISLEKRKFPLFICEKDGQIYYIIPLIGKGLWGPIWGYIGLEDDLNTVFGAVFDHKSETPGLGAEINQGWFEEPFKGKKIFDAHGNFVSITIIKGGAAPDDLHGVDAISGGTITSNGVSKMIKNTLSIYVPYFKRKS